MPTLVATGLYTITDYNDRAPRFAFIRSATKPATPTGPAPAGWTIGSIPPGSLPIWASVGYFNSTGELVDAWSDPEITSVPGTSGAYPSPANLFSAHSFDVIPDIKYPDNAAGTTYTADWTTTVDGWNNWVGTGVVSVVSGNLRSAQGNQSFIGARKSIAVTSGRMVQLMVRGSVAGAQAVWLQYYNGSTYVTFGTISAITTDWQPISAILPASTAFILVRTSNSMPAGEYIEIQKGFYIGDGSYTWTVGDDSGNGRALTPTGALARVAGRSGNAIQFDGRTASLAGTLSGFTDKITISRWIYFEPFSTIYKALVSCIGSPVLGGQWEVAINNAATPGALRVVYCGDVTERLSRTYQMPSAGWHHVAATIDTTISTDEAITLKVDGKPVTLTTSTTSALRPALFNGPYYLHSRLGTSNFAGGSTDEARIDSAILTDEEVLALYSQPMGITPTQIPDLAPRKRASGPTDPLISNPGDWYYNTATKKVRVRTLSGWQDTSEPMYFMSLASEILSLEDESLGGMTQAVDFIQNLVGKNAFFDILGARILTILTGGMIKAQSGAWSLTDQGAEFVRYRCIGLNQEVLDCGTYDGVNLVDTIDCGTFVDTSPMTLPVRLIGGGTWMEN